MNEIRHIHLGRQAYTIAADAYKELHEYLAAIKHEASSEVTDEVELRIAELLTERKITVETVVLREDVGYIKEQLGTPSDFSDGREEPSEPLEQDSAVKHLYRDGDNAMIAGVAAGLARYFDIDAVVIRLLFIALVFFGGSGVLLYILLWLLVPEAKTKSDRLRMSGLAVNVHNIKGVVMQADVPGATRRVTRLIGRILTFAARIVATIVGVAFVLAGVAMTLGSAILTVYGLVRGVHVSAATIFPVGTEQVAVLVCAMVVVAVIAALLAIIGLTLVRRKWPIPGWVLAAMIGIFIVAGSVGVGLGADVAPQVRDTYKRLEHSVSYEQQMPTSIKLNGSSVLYHLVYGDEPTVEVRTLGVVDTKNISITRDAAGVLTIDTTHFHPGTECQLVCTYGDSQTEIYIHLPKEVPVDGTGGAALSVEYGSYTVESPDGGGFRKAIPDPGMLKPVPGHQPTVPSGN
jgi:phage shock protein PspC (stress-responsive transcriptional regulator)